ncbi:putative glycosyltransferase [Aquirufa nivalisilvae]|uniref:Putative glycosyltransferase n=1 Tax=Aquirufa nivalisilvae TaxID=2516557 RepID=A0A2S2DY89_9BACT|nr:glycosyltransferase family 4 protein [Aquirufa nivalisilvae]AWL10326.1 putative glycosyltransferase [Aquirufa nivalisilvae]
MKGKKKVLFVGSFVEKAKDGSVGGQMYACKSLINSSLSESVDWVLLDTTGNSVPPPPVYIRMFSAISRVIKFIFLMVLKRPDFTLIFSANVPSIYEKGLIAVISSMMRVKCIFAPRGGSLVFDIKNSAFAAKYVPFILSKCYYVICQGNYWEGFFKGIQVEESQTNYVVIPNWIDTDKYLYKIPQNVHNNVAEVPTILFMGWIQEDKGVFDLLQALESNLLVDYKLKIVFMGDGPGKNNLIQLVSQLSHTNHQYEFPGWLHGQEKSDYLYHADVFVLPSYAEGMPNSLMEAMASGVVSIATNVGAVSELIQNKETGILVEVNDVKAIAQGIAYVLDNPEQRNRMIKQARDLIISSHSISNAALKLAKIINKG